MVGIAGSLFVLAAVLEGLGRFGDRPALHAAAEWALAAALLVVLTPLALAAVIVAAQALFARWKDRDSR